MSLLTYVGIERWCSGTRSEYRVLTLSV